MFQLLFTLNSYFLYNKTKFKESWLRNSMHLGGIDCIRSIFFQENLKRKQEEVEFNSTKKQEELIKQMKRKIEDLEDEKRDQVKSDRQKARETEKRETER